MGRTLQLVSGWVLWLVGLTCCACVDSNAAITNADAALSSDDAGLSYFDAFPTIGNDENMSTTNGYGAASSGDPFTRDGSVSADSSGDPFTRDGAVSADSSGDAFTSDGAVSADSSGDPFTLDGAVSAESSGDAFTLDGAVSADSSGDGFTSDGAVSAESSGDTDTAPGETSTVRTEPTDDAGQISDAAVWSDASTSDVTASSTSQGATSSSETRSTTEAGTSIVEVADDAGAWCREDANFAGCYDPGDGRVIDLCGNGTVDHSESEECDDGNDVAGDGCERCVVEAGWRCDEGEPCLWLPGDQACSNGCWAEHSCVERASGVTCACPEVQPEACGPLYFRSLPGLGDLGSCGPRAVSADGTTVVGACFEGNWQQFPVVWREGSLPERLAPSGVAAAVNADGSVLARFDDGQLILQPPGEPILNEEFPLYPDAMDQAASIVVGEPFIWTAEGGVISLSAPEGDGSGFAHDVSEVDSPLGGRVVGAAWFAQGVARGVIWTLDGVGNWLPNLDGADASEARAISSDGSVVVGEVWFGIETEAVRWTSGGIEVIGPGGAYAVNGDGTLIAGGGSEGAWLYDDTLGLRNLRDVLTDLGVSVDNWSSIGITAMSEDGHTLVGTAQYLGADQTNHQPRVVVVHLP